MDAKKISELEAVALIARLPDDTPLTTEEAAVFLRRSKSFLEKARRPDAKNPGPKYLQGGSERSEGANQKVVYFKRDLKAWLEGSVRENTLQAAVDRGQMRMVFDHVPYWMTENGTVDGGVEDTEVGEFFKKLGRQKIEWLLPAEHAFIEAKSLRLLSE